MSIGDIETSRPHILAVDDYFLKEHAIPEFSEIVYGEIGTDIHSNVPILVEATAIAMPNFRFLANEIFACIHGCQFISITFKSDTTATGPDNAWKDASLKYGYKQGIVSLSSAKRKPYDRIQLDGLANLPHLNQREANYLQSQPAISNFPDISQSICEQILPGHRTVDISNIFRRLSVNWILGNIDKINNTSEPQANFHCSYVDGDGGEKYTFVPVNLISAILKNEQASIGNILDQQTPENEKRLMSFVKYMGDMLGEVESNPECLRKALSRVLVRPTAEFYYSQVPMYQGVISLIGATGLIDDLDDSYFGPMYRQGVLSLNGAYDANEFPVFEYGNIVQSPDIYVGYDRYVDGRQRITTPDGKLMGFAVIPKDLRDPDVIQDIIYSCTVRVEERLRGETIIIDCEYDAAAYNKQVFTLIYDEILRVILDRSIVGDLANEVSKLMYNNHNET